MLYEFKTDLFIEMFCENISKPNLHCDGKCMLAKMQAEQNKAAAADVLKQLQHEIVFYMPNTIFEPLVLSFNAVLDAKPSQFYSSLYIYLFSPSCLNPPEKFWAN